MDGVRTISGIISHILSVNKRGSKAQSQEVDEVPVKDDDNMDEFARMDSSTDEVESECMIDRIDAKTLNLCVESITTLVNEDIRAFMEFPLLQRINIFRQMSQLLDLSFELFPLLEKRKLKPFTITTGLSTPKASADQDIDTPSNRQYSNRLSIAMPPQISAVQTS